MSQNAELTLRTENFITITDPLTNQPALAITSHTLGQLLGYEHPSQSLSKLWQRNRAELADFSTEVKLTSVDEKDRNQRVFTEEGCYLVAMLANTDKAIAFRRALAKYLKEQRQDALRIARYTAREEGVAELAPVISTLVRVGLSLERFQALTVVRGELSQAATAKAFGIGGQDPAQAGAIARLAGCGYDGGDLMLDLLSAKKARKPQQSWRGER